MNNNEPTFSLKTVKAMIKQFTGAEQVIGVPRPFIRMTGDHISAMVLNQILYLSDSFDSEDGWFFRSREQWEQDICVSPYQLDRAVKHLAQFGVEKTVKKVGGAPTLHFRVDWQKFITLFTQFLENQETKQSRPIIKKLDNQETSLSDAQETPLSKVEKLDHPLKDQKIHSVDSTKKKKGEIGAQAREDLPDWLSPEVWKRWVGYRKEINKPLTRTSLTAQINLLESLRSRGHPPEQVIEQSITNGWRGLFELKEEGNGNGSSNRSNSPVRRENQKQGSPAGVVRGGAAYDPFDGKPVV